MKKRLLNCDVLRILAFFFVVSVHSLSYIGFYKETNNSLTMIILNILRCLFITCVPLFLILTGYLMGEKKELNKKYILKLSKILVTYILCSIVYTIYISIFSGIEFNLKNNILDLLSYNGTPYAWYVNLYICLYLLIPFLNLLWESLKTKKQKKQLIIVLSILISMPTLINIFNFNDLSWFLKPSQLRTYHNIMPSYFVGESWAILYYFIGKYLKDYRLNISKIKNIILLILSMIIFGLFNYYRNYDTLFVWESYVNYYSFESLIVSFLLANLILNNFKFNLKKDKLNKLIAKISYLTFGAYLLSFIFDNKYYPYLIDQNLYLKNRLIYMPFMILLVGISSIILSYLVNIVQDLLAKIYNLVINTLKKST